MKNNYFLIPFLVFLFIGISQQKVHAQFNTFEITRCESPEEVVELIETVFLDGVEPFQYQNITFHGDPHAVGYFKRGGFIGFNKSEGIVMSSGFSETLDNGNDCEDFSDADGNTSGGTDADLAQASGYNINDACIIEFDFMPAGDSVKFNYVFGSEEYPEFVNQFNDAFGFFLSGPGINGTYSNNAINIAQVPGTNDPVTINNVNCGQHGQTCNPNLVGGSNCEFYINNLNTLNRGYHQTPLDGYTVPFVADNEVQSCNWYHIKLAIGDAVDGAYDSGVFLEKGSFDPGNITEQTYYSHPTIDTLLYETCNNHEAILYFGINSFRTNPYVLPFNVLGSATRDEDYTIQTTHAGDTIYIPVGSLYDSLIIKAIPDNNYEGIEDIQISYSPVICGFGDTNTTFVYIRDLTPMTDTVLNFSQYCEDTVNISFSSVAGGVPPYSYDWYTLGETTDTVGFIPNGDNYFTIPCTVYDTCGQQISDTAIVIVPDLDSDAGPDQSLCSQPNVELSGSAPGASTFFWTAVPADGSLTGQENNPNPVVSPVVDTEYALLAKDNCTNSDNDTTMVFVGSAVANAGEDKEICINESTQLSCNLGAADETYLWTSIPADPSLLGQENDQTIIVSPTQPTDYSVTVVNNCGFSATDIVHIEVLPLPIASAGSDDNICFGHSYQLNASGGMHYQWSSVPNDPSLFVDGQDTLSNPVVSPATQEPYTYTVQVWDLCTNTASMTLTVDAVPEINVSVDNPVSCFGSPVTLSADVLSADYTWTANPEDPSIIGQENNQTITVTPLVTTTYILVALVNGYSCPATIEQTVVVKDEILATFEVQANSICENAQFTVLYTGNASSSAVYNWDFNGATIISGSGSGPYNLSWSEMGAKTISLSVDEDGCYSALYSSGLTVIPSPVTEFSTAFQEGCTPFTVEFTNNSSNLGSSVAYDWDFGVNGSTSSESSPSYTYTTPGTYNVSLIVTNDGQCSDQLTESNYIKVNDPPVSEFVVNPIETMLADATINFTNNSTSFDNLSYDWDFGDGENSTDVSPTHTYTEQGTFLVNLLVTTPAGCENESNKEVIVYPNFAVYPPSAFSPNGDGKNDFFEIKGSGIKNYHLQIYSRWGELIYESFNLEEMWDGKVNGTPVVSGTYAYLINYQSMLGENANKKGTVTVIY